MSTKIEKLEARKERVLRELRRAKAAENAKQRKEQTRAAIIVGQTIAKYAPSEIRATMDQYLSAPDKQLIQKWYPQIWAE